MPSCSPPTVRSSCSSVPPKKGENNKRKYQLQAFKGARKLITTSTDWYMSILAAISYSCSWFLCPGRTVLLPSPLRSPEQDICILINSIKPSVIYQAFYLRPCCRHTHSFMPGLTIHSTQILQVWRKGSAWRSLPLSTVGYVTQNCPQNMKLHLALGLWNKNTAAT